MMKKFTKIALIVASFVLVIALSVGGTIAWLQDETDIVTNTFSPTDITIELKEHDYVVATNEHAVNGVLGKLLDDEANVNDETKHKEIVTEADYNLVPGVTLPKDPFIRVIAGSEPCYIYVEVVENVTADDYLDYSVNTTDWISLGATGKEGGNVYYYKAEVASMTTDQVFGQILTDNKVMVPNTLTNDAMDELTAEDSTLPDPQLKFFGYAIQAATFADQTTAWNTVYPQYATTNTPTQP